MANYTDGLCELDLNWYLNQFCESEKVGCFLSVKPSFTFHVVKSDENGMVKSIDPETEAEIGINVGFFVFHKEIFDYMHDGDEIVNEHFGRMITQRQLMTQKHTGFFASIDTHREKVMFDEMFARGETPWALWDAHPRN